VAALPALFEILQQDDLTIFVLQTSKLSDANSIKLVGEALTKLVTTPECQKLIIDLQSATSMGSAALSQLVVINKKMRERMGHLRVCNLQPMVAEVFRITHLNRALAVDETRGVSIAIISPGQTSTGRETPVVPETMTLGGFESLPTEEIRPEDRD